MSEQTIYERRPYYAWWVAAIFMFAGLLSYTDRQIFNLLVDPIRHDLGVTDTQVSLLQGAAFACLYAVAGIPLGILADRYSRKLIIITGILVWSAATVACGFAKNIEQLFLARFLVGIGEACLAPAVISLIADYFPSHRRGMPTGLFIMGMALGVGSSIIFSGGILELYNDGAMQGLPVLGALAPWRGVLMLAGLIGIVVALAMLTVSEPPRTRLARAVETAKPTFREVYRYFSERRALFIPLYIGLAITTVSDYATFSWAPSLMIRRFEQTPGDVALWMGSAAIITAVIGASLGGVLTDMLERLGGKNSKLRVAAAMCAVLLIASTYPAYPSKIMVMAMLTIYLVVAAMVGVIIITAIQDILPSDMRGIGSAIIAFCNTILGLGFGPTLVALFNDHVFTEPSGVAMSLPLVTVPASFIGMSLLFLAARNAGQNSVRPVADPASSSVAK